VAGAVTWGQAFCGFLESFFVEAVLPPLSPLL